MRTPCATHNVLLMCLLDHFMCLQVTLDLNPATRWTAEQVLSVVIGPEMSPHASAVLFVSLVAET
jgi:hypothetical protein